MTRAKIYVPPRAILLAIFIIGFGLATTGPVLAQLSIPRPNFGVPEFTQPGSTFRAEVTASAGLTNTLWAAVLTNDLRAWTGIVEQVEYGSYVNNDTATGYRLTIRTPADISPEVFKLVISHPAGGAATNRNAVGIVQNLETNFYILHYADPQAHAYKPDNPETGMYSTHGSIREMYWHAPALSLINPRFLFDTGDELDNAYGTSVARYQEYIDAMCQAGIPVLATRGNNDNAISTADWRSTIGIETYSISMGSFYICQKDYNATTYTAWLTNNYAASFTNSAIHFRLFGQHFISGGAAWLPPAGQVPGLMLVGHGHANSTLQTSPYYIIETQQACNKGAVGFFEFVRTSTNWTCTSLTNISAAQFQVMSSGAVARITHTFAYANNGLVFTNTATISNQIPQNFWDGRVRFLMKYSAAGYDVSNGVKLAEYSYNGDSNMAVVVQVNIAKSATTVVGIRPLLTLSVTGPAYGSSSPAHGIYTNSFGTSFNVAVTNSAVIVGGTTQYVCQGWTGSGSVPAAGETTNTSTLTLTNNSTLAWCWTTNYWLASAAAENGSVNVGDSWQPAGVTTQITATANPYYHFTNWTGSASGAHNPLEIPMDSPQSVQAHFAANLAASNTPEWWLAEHGWTHNFDAAATNDDEPDGFPTWQEYIADTDPTNATSYPQMTYVETWQTNQPILTWPFSTGRMYQIHYCDDLVIGAWITQQLFLGTGEWTDTNPPPITNRYYRIAPRLP